MCTNGESRKAGATELSPRPPNQCGGETGPPTHLPMVQLVRGRRRMYAPSPPPVRRWVFKEVFSSASALGVMANGGRGKEANEHTLSSHLSGYFFLLRFSPLPLANTAG